MARNSKIKANLFVWDHTKPKDTERRWGDVPPDELKKIQEVLSDRYMHCLGYKRVASKEAAT